MLYDPKPIDTGKIELPPEIVKLTEALAENSHENWAVGRIKEGWKYGPQRDDNQKTHPLLVAYSELPDSEKQYDRNSAMETLKVIYSLGYKIVSE